jgi:hypothetical protein
MFGDVWQFLSFSFYAHISIKCPNKAPKWGNPKWASQTKHNIFFYQLWAAHQGAMLWAIWTRGYGLQEFAIWILAIWLLCIG